MTAKAIKQQLERLEQRLIEPEGVPFTVMFEPQPAVATIRTTNAKGDTGNNRAWAIKSDGKQPAEYVEQNEGESLEAFRSRMQ